MVSVISIGAGDRGNVYASFSKKIDNFNIIGVAEPNNRKREIFAYKYNIPENMCFNSWEDIFKQDKMADAVIITTPDQMHVEPAVAALKSGYHVLLEKPMASKLDDVKLLVKEAEKSDQILQICHVLRYTPFYSKVYELISTGVIGDIAHISMSENVGYYHYAHSFIRGNWHNRNESSPMILAKCCHDLDIMYWLVGKLPISISSFGSQLYFGKKNAPRKDLPERCIQGCPISDTCPYYAPHLYIDLIPLLRISTKTGSFIDKIMAKLLLKYPGLKKYPLFNRANNYYGWPINIISSEPGLKAKIDALETGPYGRCVYDIDDHDVVDHQVVNIEFSNGITGSLVMHGFAAEEKREIRIDGTHGTLQGVFSTTKQELTIIQSPSGKTFHIQFQKNTQHGGGDEGIIKNFIETLNKIEHKEDTTILTDAQESLVSHIMAFAADISRVEGKIVNYDEIAK